MTLTSLQALTWGTIGGAVASALMLASGVPTWSHVRHTDGTAATTPTSSKGAQSRSLATVQPLIETQRQIGVR